MQVNALELTKDHMLFDGSLHAQNVTMDAGSGQGSFSQMNLENIKLRQDKDGIQIVADSQHGYSLSSERH